MAVKPVVYDDSTKKHRPLGSGEKMDGLSASSIISSQSGNLITTGSDGLAYATGSGIADPAADNLLEATPAGKLKVDIGRIVEWLDGHPDDAKDVAEAINIVSGDSGNLIREGTDGGAYMSSAQLAAAIAGLTAAQLQAIAALLAPDLADGLTVVLNAAGKLSVGDISGVEVAASGAPAERALGDRFADFVNLKDFGAVGDGSTNDTAAWTAWQAALADGGVGYIPAGEYSVGGTVLKFKSGCVGNGVFDDSAGYWDQVHRNPSDSVYDDGDNTEVKTIIQNQSKYDASSAVHGPAVKTQTDIEYNMTTAANSYNFTRVVGAYHEAVGHGNYRCSADNRTGNFTCFGASASNKFAGQFGMTAVTGRVWDAKESDVAGINVSLGLDEETGRYVVTGGYGSSKSCAGYFPFIRQSKHRNGGYMLGLEVYCMNVADETENVPYLNNDTFTFRREPDKPGTGGAWTCGFHCTAKGGSTASGAPKGAPISAGILLDGAGDARHGFWNGIVVGSSCMKINGDTEGYPGTVGISFASWRAPKEDGEGNRIAGRYGDQAIRFGYANHHLHFKSGARIWSPATVIGYDGLSDDDETVEYSGLTIMAPADGMPYLNMGTGAFAGERTNKFGIGVFGSSGHGNVLYNLRSGSSHVFAFTAAPAEGEDPVTTYVYNLNTGYFTCSGEQTLGTGQSFWGQIYSTSATINTSDERFKQDIEALPDALLDAWEGIDWKQFRFKDAVAEKGEAARTHTGLVAQRVKAVLDAAGIDGAGYGFLCHDEWDDVYESVTVVDEPAHLNDEDELVPDRTHVEQRLAKPAGDRWSLRYEEALCIEAAYVRRELARIKARLGMNG